VAAHLDPDILIIDEVLAVGDAEFQKKCMGKMRDVSTQGRTVLFVSHNMSAVEQLCSSIVLLREGRVLSQSDDVRGSITKYLFSDSGDRAVWTNPGTQYANPYFKPLEFYLADDQGNPLATSQRNDADVWVCVDAQIEAVDPALTVGYALFNEGGDCLYWSYQTDDAAEAWPRLRPGRNSLRSKLPQRLLNQGRYRVELIGGLTFREWLFEPGVNAPAVTLTIDGALSPSPLYTHARPTLLAPILSWAAVDDAAQDTSSNGRAVAMQRTGS
jgi:lipopolysaccharide transport system ATP-binding protein